MFALEKMNSMFWLSTNLGWMAAVTATKTIRTAIMPNSRTRKMTSTSRREFDASSPAGLTVPRAVLIRPFS